MSGVLGHMIGLHSIGRCTCTHTRSRRCRDGHENGPWERAELGHFGLCTRQQGLRRFILSQSAATNLISPQTARGAGSCVTHVQRIVRKLAYNPAHKTAIITGFLSILLPFIR